jgi:hypothetical protein
MSSVFTPKRMRISTDRYHKMIAAGELFGQADSSPQLRQADSSS